jgi:hypothetical protein
LNIDACLLGSVLTYRVNRFKDRKKDIISVELGRRAVKRQRTTDSRQ